MLLAGLHELEKIEGMEWQGYPDNPVIPSKTGRLPKKPEEPATNTYCAIKDHRNYEVALVDASGTEITASACGNRYAFQGREVDWRLLRPCHRQVAPESRAPFARALRLIPLAT